MSSVRVISHAAPILAGFQRAQEQGLIAAANVIRNAVLRRLRGGYQSSLGNKGAFVTGASLTHVTISTPVFTANSGSISVGTDLLYNLFWEIGHHNLFTRHYERDQKWSPAFNESRADAHMAYIRVVRRGMGGAP